MRKVSLIVFTILILAASSTYSVSAVGSVFGNMTTAKTQGQGIGSFGLVAGIADYTSVAGTFKYGLSKFTDGTLKIAFVDPGKADDDLHLAIGASFNHQFMVMDEVTKSTFEMGYGGFFEYLDVGPSSVFQVGGRLIGSYPVVMTNGKTLTPYGSFNARLESISFDNTPIGVDNSDSNIEFGFNFGVEWELSNNIKIMGEFQLDGNDGLFIGADFGVL